MFPFLVLLGAGAVTAFGYFQRQYGAITAALDGERIKGSRSLRAVYLASHRTVISTLRALLSPGRERVFTCEQADADGLVAKLKTLRNGKEKKKAWEELKIASIVRLVVSVYYLVEVYLVLLVQVNLVARYSAVDADAPVQNLAGGTFGLESKQRFLSLARSKLFEQGGVEKLVDLVHEVSEEVVGPLRLTELVGPDDVRNLLRDICRRVEAKSGLRAHIGQEVRRVGSTPEETYSVSRRMYPVLDARWLLVPRIPHEDSAGGEDALDQNVKQLVSEALDLCDVLDYDVLLRTNVDALIDVAGGLVNGYVWGVSGMEEGGKVALAPVIAKIANVSKMVLGSGTGPLEKLDAADESAETDAVDSSKCAHGPFVDALLQSGSCEAFGAAVFLSGERTGGDNN